MRLAGRAGHVDVALTAPAREPAAFKGDAIGGLLPLYTAQLREPAAASSCRAS